MRDKLRDNCTTSNIINLRSNEPLPNGFKIHSENPNTSHWKKENQQSNSEATYT